MKIIYFCIFYLAIASTMHPSDVDSANEHSEELDRKFNLSTENILEAVRNLKRRIESTNATPAQIDAARTAALTSAQAAQNTLDRQFLRNTLTGPKRSSDEQGRPTLVIINKEE